MPVESTLSTKELRKTWTGKSSRAKATSRKPKKARADPKIAAPKVAPPQVDTVVTLFFKASNCCAPGAKPHFHCSHPAKVLSVSADEFKAQCSDKTVWKIEIQSKRTGFNPKGNWAASGASAAAFEANDTFDDDL